MIKKFKKLLSPYRYWFLGLALAGITLRVLLAKDINDLVVLALLAFLVLGMFLVPISAGISIFSGLLLLFFCPVLMLIDQTFMAEKLAVWAFIFLSIGIFQRLIGFLKNEK